MNTNSKKVYVCCFKHEAADRKQWGDVSCPMAIFTNEKAAKDYTESHNAEGRHEYFYYDMDAYTSYWWKP